MIRWLVVGTGAVGRAHAAAIRLTPGAGLAGCVSLEAPTDTSVPHFATLPAALAALRPDAVVIATPHDTHHSLGALALDAGVPTLFEKPVGLSTAEARALAGFAATRGVQAGAVLNQRGCRHHAWLAGEIRAGRLRPRYVGFSGSLARLGSWHADPRRAGGGLLRTIGLHYVDLLRWWLGEPLAVSALVAGEPAEDRCAVALRFADGALGSLQLAATAARSLGPVRALIEGEGARVELVGHEIVRVEGLGAPPPLEPPEPTLTYGPGHLAVIGGATAALAAGRPFPVPLDEALPSLALLDRLYAAAAAADQRS